MPKTSKKRTSRVDWRAVWRAFDAWLEVGFTLYGSGPTITQMTRRKIHELVEEQLRRAR